MYNHRRSFRASSTSTIFVLIIFCLWLFAAPMGVGATSNIITVDSPGDVGNFTSLVLNSSGFPVISYYDNTNGDLKLAVCADTLCTSKTLTTVDNSTNQVGQYTSIVLNSSGFPVISYYDFTA